MHISHLVDMRYTGSKQQWCVPVQVVVGKKMDDIFMVMEFMEHDLKGLMEAQDASGPVFAMSEVSHCSHV